MINFPDYLPVPLREGHVFSHISSTSRVGLVCGRSRQRRIFGRTPSFISVSWLFANSSLAQAFEAWYRGIINNGADWFNSEIKSDFGYEFYECRFSEMYVGPKLVELDNWLITATLEIKFKPES